MSLNRRNLDPALVLEPSGGTCRCPLPTEELSRGLERKLGPGVRRRKVDSRG